MNFRILNSRYNSLDSLMGRFFFSAHSNLTCKMLMPTNLTSLRWYLGSLGRDSIFQMYVDQISQALVKIFQLGVENEFLTGHL